MDILSGFLAVIVTLAVTVGLPAFLLTCVFSLTFAQAFVGVAVARFILRGDK